MTSVATAQDLRAEQRTFDILALVRVAFAEKGFDGGVDARPRPRGGDECW